MAGGWRQGASRVGAGVGATARVSAMLAARGWRRTRAATHADGAGETGLASLTELHGVHSAGDALFTVALAGTLFFSPTDPHTAKSRVALYLLLTMAPFALVSPVIGPVLDRVRHGRRYAIAVTLGGRAFLSWIAAGALGGHTVGLSLYPAALGVLVLSKAYNVVRSAATPRLLPPTMTLVSANARQSMAGLITAAIGGGIAGGLAHEFGASWALRVAFLVYAAAAVLALRLPSHIDSAAGEERLDGSPKTGPLPSWRGVLRHPRALLPRAALLPSVRIALRAQAALRALAGFLTLYLAFLIRTGHLHGASQGLELSLLVLAAGGGGVVGTMVGARLPQRAPESIIMVSLAVATASTLAAAALFGVASAILLAFVAGLAQTVGKLGLDAIVQRDVEEAVRTSTFARSETVNQLGWVLGGAIGLALPVDGEWGFALGATWLVAALVFTVRDRRVRSFPAPPVPPPPMAPPPRPVA